MKAANVLKFLSLALCLSHVACKTTKDEEKQSYWWPAGGAYTVISFDVKISGDKMEVLNDVASEAVGDASNDDPDLTSFCSFKILKGTYQMSKGVESVHLARIGAELPEEANTDYLHGREFRTMEKGKTYISSPDVIKMDPTGALRFISYPVSPDLTKSSVQGLTRPSTPDELFAADIVKIRLIRGCAREKAAQ